MADIWHDQASGSWLLEMRSTCYAFGLADDGTALRHLYWGATLPRAALASLESQYVASDGARVVVLSWWGPHQGGVRPPRLWLRGLEPGARYLEAGSGREHLGGALMQEGLALPDGTGSDYGSALIQLSRLP